jgi:hypothetical protein
VGNVFEFVSEGFNFALEVDAKILIPLGPVTAINPQIPKRLLLIADS